jgi:hypothetical protein
LNIFNGFGYSFAKKKMYITKGKDYWHPGFAWALTRKAYEKIGGLYDKGILGSGDNIMALSSINSVEKTLQINYHQDYINSILEFQKKIKILRLGYTPGVIRHHYHGSKQNRKYTERWQILIKYQYSPDNNVTYDCSGILIPTQNFDEDFKNEIMNYFQERKEDN